jgi:hypothetical protein
VGDADLVCRDVVLGADRPKLVEVVRRGRPFDTPLEQGQVERRGDLDGADPPRLPGEPAVVPAELRPVVLEDRRLALPVVVPVVGVEVAVEVDDVGRVVQPLRVPLAVRHVDRIVDIRRRRGGGPELPIRGMAGERLRHADADAGEILPGGEREDPHDTKPGTLASAWTIRSPHSRWSPCPPTSGTVTTS